MAISRERTGYLKHENYSYWFLTFVCSQDVDIFEISIKGYFLLKNHFYNHTGSAEILFMNVNRNTIRFCFYTFFHFIVSKWISRKKQKLKKSEGSDMNLFLPDFYLIYIWIPNSMTNISRQNWQRFFIKFIPVILSRCFFIFLLLHGFSLFFKSH